MAIIQRNEISDADVEDEKVAYWIHRNDTTNSLDIFKLHNYFRKLKRVIRFLDMVYVVRLWLQLSKSLYFLHLVKEYTLGNLSNFKFDYSTVYSNTV